MGKKFITLFYKGINEHLNILIDFFKGLLGNNLEVLKNDSSLTIIFDAGYDVDFSLLAASINTDFYLDSSLYESQEFTDHELLNNYLKMVLELNLTGYHEYYFNDEFLIVKGLGNKELIKEVILKKYHNDYEMCEVIKTYLDCNMNITKAANALYMHRNTVMNKIDKFISVTGYDIKSFKKAFIIYHLL